MSKRKNQFPCGHKGYGQFCHQCAGTKNTSEKSLQQNRGRESTSAPLLPTTLNQPSLLQQSLPLGLEEWSEEDLILFYGSADKVYDQKVFGHTSKQSSVRLPDTSNLPTLDILESSPDPISLQGLPVTVTKRCREIFARLQTSVNYNHQLRGKRLRFDRTVISIPLPHYYRMLCRDEGRAIVPLRVVSHQEYNKIVRNAAIKLTP
jgi:hypothetical protein